MIPQNSLPTRNGISIIEVLTSIVVAMIGVFGVMVMIPFAISQAEQGLDQEKASSLNLNAVSEFEMRDYINTNRWALVDAAGALVSVGNFSARPYVIDPIGVADRTGTVPALPSGQFPFLHPGLQGVISAAGSITQTDAAGNTTTFTGQTDQNILIDRVTIANENVLATGAFSGTASGMSRRLASHLFAWSSELVFNEPVEADLGGNYEDTEIAPPQQVLDVMSNGAFSGRQLLKEMEYMVVAVPNDIAAIGAYDPFSATDRVLGWRNYFLAYKDRPSPLAVTPDPADAEAYDRVFQVTAPIDQAGIPSPADPVPDAATLTPLQSSYRKSIAGGDLVMTEVFPPASTIEYTTQRWDIRRGDWMMLINVIYNPARQRYFKQINFFKVFDSDFNDANNNGIQDPGESWNVSLQGPDFDFLYPIPSVPPVLEYYRPNAIPAGFGCEVTRDDGTPLVQIRPSQTFAIHLPDVWAVFERTYQ